MILKLVICLTLVNLATSKSMTENEERYMIMLYDEATLHEVNKVMEVIEWHEQRERETMEMKFINNLLPIVIANISKDTAKKVESLREVKYIEADQLMYMTPTVDSGLNLTDHSTDHYNLDIMNKPTKVCRNGEYSPPNGGAGADIYILDTGIEYDHPDFMGPDGVTRAKYGGYEAVKPPNGGTDCQGHGSHCAGIAGGLKSGVAKSSNLLSIRVLGCLGSGSTSGIMDALDFVSRKHEENKHNLGFVASIVSMSLGGGKSNAFNTQVNKLVSKGVTVVTASGNDGADACGSSPGSAGENINVGAHAVPVKKNAECLNPLESFSNYGSCVHVMAPGRNVMSVDYKSDGLTEKSGTSMACPHVAGAAALIMKDDPNSTPRQVKSRILNGAARDIDRSKQSDPAREVSASERLFVPTSF